MRRSHSFLILIMLGIFASPHDHFAMQKASRSHVEKQIFGQLSDGTSVDIYTLTNRNGLQAKITNYGAIVVSITTPDRRGQMTDVTLGYDNLQGYVQDATYFGAIVGRYANRIAKGRFSLGGSVYTLAQNNNGNHLHGGLRGFNKVVWNAASRTDAVGAHLKLSYLSKDKEEGYPGNLSVTVTYTLNNANELKIDYLATTDKETVLNLTNHCYFNLAGAGNILGHELKINADHFTPTDKTSIPTGELRSVKNTPFDFTRSTLIGARIEAQDEQLLFGNGYDHNFVLNKKSGVLALAAEAYEPMSGRVLQVLTTEPGVQFYSGNFLKDVQGKAGKVYQKRDGFCLEAQHFPDSPNKPQFPSVVLKPGAAYKQTTIYKFSAR